jgi:hypothetical protein
MKGLSPVDIYLSNLTNETFTLQYPQDIAIRLTTAVTFHKLHRITHRGANTKPEALTKYLATAETLQCLGETNGIVSP